MNKSARIALVVDDEPLLAEVAGWTLEEHGYVVQTALNAQAAIDLIGQMSQLDLLLTDIRMPGDLDGWGLAKIVRDMFPSLPIIYMTGYSPETPGKVSRSVLLRKPFTPEELVGAIHSLSPELGEDSALTY